MQNMSLEISYFRYSTLEQYTGVPAATWRNMVANGNAPPSFKLNPDSKRSPRLFPKEGVDQWLKEKMEITDA